MVTPIANSSLKPPATMKGGSSQFGAFGTTLSNFTSGFRENELASSPNDCETPAKKTAPSAAIGKGRSTGVARDATQASEKSLRKRATLDTADATPSIFLPANTSAAIIPPQLDVKTALTNVAVWPTEVEFSGPASRLTTDLNHADKSVQTTAFTDTTVTGPLLKTTDLQPAVIQEESHIVSPLISSNAEDSSASSSKEEFGVVTAHTDNQPPSAWLIAEEAVPFASYRVDGNEWSTGTETAGQPVIPIHVMAGQILAGRKPAQADTPDTELDRQRSFAFVPSPDKNIAAQISGTHSSLPSATAAHANSSKSIFTTVEVAHAAPRLSPDAVSPKQISASSPKNENTIQTFSKSGDPPAPASFAAHAGAGKDAVIPPAVIVNPQLGLSDPGGKNGSSGSRNDRPVDQSAKAKSDDLMPGREIEFNKAKDGSADPADVTNTHEALASTSGSTEATAIVPPAISQQEASRTTSVAAATQNTLPELAKAHQVLDAAPPLHDGNTSTARIIDGQDGNLQMHVALRTTAFGTVEIHTLVQQNQVGLTINGDHGFSHWVAPEMHSIVSGLRDNCLNLASVQLSNSNVLHAGSGSHQDQPQGHSFQPANICAASSDPQREADEAVVLTQPLEAYAVNRVSIHI